MRRSLLVFLALLMAAGLGSAPAGAQAPAQIRSLEISMWPEYDRPAVLVIYRMRLSSPPSMPVKVSVPIPAKVGDPHAVAMRGEDGSLLVAPYTRDVQGEWATITIESTSPEVQLEFYQDLQLDGDRRSYTFRWPGGVAVDSVAYEIQQPYAAGSLEISPPPQGEVTGPDGLLYYSADLGALESAQQLDITFTYSRSESRLTAELLQSIPPLSSPAATQGRTPDLMEMLPWLLGGFGLLLLVVGGVLYWRLGREPTVSSSRRRRRRPRAAEDSLESTASEPRVEGPARYCHQCGARVGEADRYCRNCGAKLRR